MWTRWVDEGSDGFGRAVIWYFRLAPGPRERGRSHRTAPRSRGVRGAALNHATSVSIGGQRIVFRSRESEYLGLRRMAPCLGRCAVARNRTPPRCSPPCEHANNVRVASRHTGNLAADALRRSHECSAKRWRRSGGRARVTRWTRGDRSVRGHPTGGGGLTSD
jgi:hypothetical protein